MAFKTLKYELVELLVPGVAGVGNTGTSFFFPDLPKLRYVNIQAIETFAVDSVPTSPNNVALPTTAILAKSYFVGYSNERQDLWRIPLISLNRTQAAGAAATPFVRSLFEFAPQQLTWDKSYVQLSSAPANVNNFSYVFGVYYN